MPTVRQDYPALKISFPESSPSLSNSQPVKVDPSYKWQPIESCPKGVKVQLLTKGGVAVHGHWTGNKEHYIGWTPVPKQ